jgi:SAM-dependent methyltransferase
MSVDNTRKFAGKGGSYQQHRPGYAFATFEAMFKELGLTGAEAAEIVVADIGAGTGFVSCQLAGIAKVIGVEPDPSMRFIASAELDERKNTDAIGAANLLYRSNLNDSFITDGRSDSLGMIAASSIDIITSGTAAHWFAQDPNPTLAEWNRVLKPEGKVAILFSFLDVDHEATSSLVNLYKERFNVKWEELGLFRTKALSEKFIDSNSQTEASVDFILRMDKERFLNWLGTTSGPTREQFSEADLECLGDFFDKYKNKKLFKDVGDEAPKEVIEILYKSSVYVGALKGREVNAELERAARK